MWVKNLSLVNFRNYDEISLEFSKGINFIQGENGSGKTSLVESIGLLALCKSIRSNDEKETIKIGKDNAVITASIENQINRDFKIVISQNGKYIEIDGNETKRTSEMAGIIKIVSFLPKDVDLFKDIPLKRRKFIDLNLSMIDSTYLKILNEYNKYLNELRILLKQNQIDQITLNILCTELSKRGYVLQKKREEFIDLLNRILIKIGKYFSDDSVKFNLQYHPNIEMETEQDYLNQVKERIDISLSGDKNRIAIPGIHLDDLSMLYNQLDLSLYGSQGQNRLSVICLKLSLYELIKSKFKEEPIVILDDVLSELDDQHQSKLIESLNQIEQVFITGTKFDLKEKVTLFNVDKNLVGRIN